MTLAADYHRRSCEPGSRNQREVRVEIEGMRDRDTIPSQILSQSKARPQRFQAVQTAAKRKFRYATQAIEKRTTSLNATQMDPESRSIQTTGPAQ